VAALEARELLSAPASVGAEVRVAPIHDERHAAALTHTEAAEAERHQAARPSLDGRGQALSPNHSRSGSVTSQADAEIYVPPGLEPGQSVPLLVVFNAGGNASASIRYWKAQANSRKWIVYASREYSDARSIPGNYSVYPGESYNQVLDSFYTDPNLLATVKTHIDAAVARLPVDPSRIILTGFSGGAFFSHDLNAAYPGFAAAVIDNSNGEPGIAEDGDIVDGVPTAGSFTGSRREAIFMVGQRDHLFRSQIEETIPVYQNWGWQTLMLTYPGGHKPAPTSVLAQAINWLVSRPSWA
jgi:hypothetical protein